MKTFSIYLLLNLFIWIPVCAQSQGKPSLPDLEKAQQTLKNLPLRLEDKSILEQAKKYLDNLPDIAPDQTNISYKTRMFSNAGYSLKDILVWLPHLITQMPEQQRPLFKRASQLLQQKEPPAEKIPAVLSQNNVFQAMYKHLQQHKPLVLNKNAANPFLLPDLQKARVILIGEDHTMHYPAEQLVEYLIAYNQSAPENERITHLFVEFSYQANIAMEFIRAHIKELPEKELLKQAVEYAHKQMGKKYIPATLREEVRWLRLGYRLLKEQPDVVFYAYDLPNPSIDVRNAAAKAFLRAGYEQPNTKMVFIGGALHVLRYNLNTPLFSDPSINAQNSLANTSGIPPQEVVSIFAVGGMPWKEDAQLYGSSSAQVDLYHFAIEFYKNTPKNLAVKTPAKLFGFDYYFYFDVTKKPFVTDANTW